MSVPSTSPLNIQEVPQLITKHRRLLVTSVLVGGLLATVASILIPRRYKAHFVFTIYTKYFQSSMVGDFVPSLGESGDPRGQRDSLIRQTLTPEFLDSLGEKYGIYASTTAVGPASSIQKLRTRLKTKAVEFGLYQPPSAESRRTTERQTLLTRIDIFPVNNTTFNIGFSYSNPQVAYRLTQDLNEHIVSSLLDIRTNILVTVRNAIQSRLGGLSTSSASSREPQHVAPTSAQEELKSVRSELSVLTVSYTDAHPLVKQLRDRERFLMRAISSRPPSEAGAPAASGALREEDTTAAIHDLSGDLIKKLNYLDIAIDSDRHHQGDYFVMLESPMLPTSSLGMSRAVFPVGGVIFGFICALFIAAIREYFDRTAIRTSVLAQRLGVPVIGELPPFPQKASALGGAEPSKTAGG